MGDKHSQMIPWDLAGEASGTAPSGGAVAGADAGGVGAAIGGVVSLSAFEAGDSTGAKSPEDGGLCA